MESFSNSQTASTLKKINLQQYQKPKTLIVVHYKGKRISVPLLGECKNLTQMLYHHIDKFQQTVMKSSPDWQKISNKKIVCFCSLSSQYDKKNSQNNANTYDNNNLKSQLKQNEQGGSHHKNKDENQRQFFQNSLSGLQIKKKIQQYLKYSDGDLKIDILLSMIRIQAQNSSNNVCDLDITKYYKYMEIQPFQVFIQKELSSKNYKNNKRKSENVDQTSLKNMYTTAKIQQNHKYSNYPSRLYQNQYSNEQDKKYDEYRKIMQSRNKSNFNFIFTSKYFFYRLLQNNIVKNVYLARNVQNGYFYEVKVYKSNDLLALKQARFLLYTLWKNQLNKENQCNLKHEIDHDPILLSLINSELHIIPFKSKKASNHNRFDQSEQQTQSKNTYEQRNKNRYSQQYDSSQQEQQESQQDQQKLQKKNLIIQDIQTFHLSKKYESLKQKFKQIKRAKHLAIVSRYNPKGKLQEKLTLKKQINSNASMSMNQLLKYLKQLIVIVHTLQQKYNIIHRNITPQNIEIDEFGNLKLVDFTSWVKCYQQDRFQSQNINRKNKRKLVRLKYPKNENNLNSHSPYLQYKKIEQIYKDATQFCQQFQGNQGQWYDIGIYTPPQVIKKSKNGYDKMVDYYSVGIIIKKLFEKENHFQFNINYQQSQNFYQQLSSSNRNSQVSVTLMHKIISNLISQNIQQRQEIVKNLLQGMQINFQGNIQEKSSANKKAYFTKQKSNYKLKQPNEFNQSNFLSTDIQISNLNELNLGKFIPLVSSKCVQNEISYDQYNGISHEEVIQYFKPVSKARKIKNLNSQSPKKKKKKEVKKDGNIKISRNKSIEGKNSNSITNSRQKGNKKSIQKNSSSITSHSHKLPKNDNFGQVKHKNNSGSFKDSSTMSKQRTKSKIKQKSKSKQKNDKNSTTNSRQKKQKHIDNDSEHQSQNRKQSDGKNNFNMKNNSNKSKSKEKHIKLQYQYFQTGVIKSPMTNTAYASLGNLHIPHPKK